jgi:hypothetical protein
MLCPDTKAFTLAWSVSEGLAGTWAFFCGFTFPRAGILEVGSLSAESCWSAGSLSGAGWSIIISTTILPAFLIFTGGTRSPSWNTSVASPANPAGDMPPTTRLYALALKARENNQVRYAEQLEDIAVEAAAEADSLVRSARTSEQSATVQQAHRPQLEKKD